MKSKSHNFDQWYWYPKCPLRYKLIHTQYLI